MSDSDQQLTTFTLNGNNVAVSFVETQTVKEGVECDIYTFDNDTSKDLAIVRVKKGYKTPLQRVLLGNKTIEGFVSGVGTLTVDSQVHDFGPDHQNNEIFVGVGQTMQWYATGDNLTFYEICDPPYQDGRFANLPE